MANTLIQFRTGETARIKAIDICEKLGIDLPTYLRMCMSRLMQEKRKSEDAYLVTGNIKHFPSKPFVVTPR